MVAVREIATSLGPARVHAFGPRSRAIVALGHGAGGGVEAPDLQAVAAAIARSGRRVVLVEQPWRVAGRRVAPRPEALDSAWLEVIGRLQPTSLVVGGRSAGARVACRTAGLLGARAVLALAFPLHPPGRPDRSRADELATGLPTLVIQGSQDPFGSADEVRGAAAGVHVVGLEGTDHSLRARRGSSPDVLLQAGSAAAEFLDQIGE